MGTNAEYYNNAYNTGVTEMYRGYIEEAREAAELTNKSLAERRSELQRIIRDLDSDIMSAQSAIESGQTTHFRAHMTARGDRVRAARAAARGRGAAGNALEKLRKDASKKAAASLQEAVEFAAAQGPDAPSLTTSEALSTLTSRSSMAGFLGQIGMVPGDPSAGRISAAERDAVSIGMREGIEIGLAANNFDATSGQIDDTAEQITGVSPTLQSYQATKNAAANQVGARTSSVSRGPVVTDADVDRALEESGLVSSIAQREADIERMQADRSAAMAAAAGLPGEMTEEQILQQAAGRMGDIGRYAGQPQNFIAVQRNLNDARRRFAEQEAQIAENETQRAAIRSMSPSQRILLQASLDGLDLKQRHPRGMPPELTEQSMDFSSQISNAMRNDPSLRGNDKAVVELAIHLAEQSNPDASVEEVRAMRDRILQGIVFEESKKQDVAAHFPEVQQAIHKRREEEIDALELAAVDPSEIKVEEVITEDLDFSARVNARDAVFRRGRDEGSQEPREAVFIRGVDQVPDELRQLFDFDQPGFDAPLITGAVEGGEIPFVEGRGVRTDMLPLYDDLLLERAR